MDIFKLIQDDGFIGDFRLVTKEQRDWDEAGVGGVNWKTGTQEALADVCEVLQEFHLGAVRKNIQYLSRQSEEYPPS